MSGRSRRAEASASGERQVDRRLLDGEPADDARVDVVAGKVHTRTTAEDRDEQRQALAVEAGSGASRRSVDLLARRAPGPRRAAVGCPRASRPTATPGAPSDSVSMNAAAGIGDLAQSVGGHLEDAHLVGRAEAVLARAQQPQAGEALAFERQHDVDDVLERLGPGQRAVLGHVADEDHRDAVLLGVRLQPRGGLARPGRRSPQGPRGRRRSASGSSRRPEARGGGLGRGDDALDDGLRQDVDRSRAARATRKSQSSRRACAAEPPTPRPRRTGRERPCHRCATAPHDGQHERRFADARLAAEQHQLTRARGRRRARDRPRGCRARCDRLRASSSSLSGVTPGRRRVRGPSRARADACARRQSRQACSSRRTSGTGLPSAGSSHRTCHTRSGFRAAPLGPLGACLDRDLLLDRLDGQAGVLALVDDERSCRPGSGPSAAPRPAGPRPCSGSRAAADARRSRCRSRA